MSLNPTGARQSKPLLIDGGMGQELIHRSGRKPTPLWSLQALLDQPELVHALHLDFIRAGARVITLNTYAATPERLQSHGLEHRFDEIQQTAVGLARQAVTDSKIDGVRVAGCLPPLVASYRPSLTPASAEALAAYRRVVASQQAGVDLFICETMASAREAVAAVTAASESGLPVWVAYTVADDGSGRLRSGESIDEAISALQGLEVEAILLNCSRPESISQAWNALIEATHSHPEWSLGAYANGFTSVANLPIGGTVEHLQARVDLDPAAYAEHAMHWVAQGARIVGGCCEVGPDHIRFLAERLERLDT